MITEAHANLEMREGEFKNKKNPIYPTCSS